MPVTGSLYIFAVDGTRNSNVRIVLLDSILSCSLVRVSRWKIHLLIQYIAQGPCSAKTSYSSQNCIIWVQSEGFEQTATTNCRNGNCLRSGGHLKFCSYKFIYRNHAIRCGWVSDLLASQALTPKATQ